MIKLSEMELEMLSLVLGDYIDNVDPSLTVNCYRYLRKLNN